MAKSEATAETLQLYAALLASVGLEQKGKNMPYTSMNGNMYSFVAKEGYVGIRLSKEDFDEQAFLKLPWQSGGLGLALFEQLSASKELIVLEEKEDIDNVEDLLFLILSLRISQLLLLLRKLFHTALNKEKELPIHYSRLPGPEQALRAPPISLSL